jgi:hypothetical protein
MAAESRSHFDSRLTKGQSRDIIVVSVRRHPATYLPVSLVTVGASIRKTAVTK